MLPPLSHENVESSSLGSYLWTQGRHHHCTVHDCPSVQGLPNCAFNVHLLTHPPTHIYDSHPTPCAACTDNQGQPIQLRNHSFEGDKFRPELEYIDATVRDTQGRPYPGNTLRDQGQVIAQCYNEDEVHLIRITDSCPCTQVRSACIAGLRQAGPAEGVHCLQARLLCVMHCKVAQPNAHVVTTWLRVVHPARSSGMHSPTAQCHVYCRAVLMLLHRC
jgi:hypothetical protein